MKGDSKSNHVVYLSRGTKNFLSENISPCLPD
jgi:hypothetical protein